MKPRILFRADGDSQMGMGHIFRCLGLAELLRDEFKLFLLTRNHDASVETLASAAGMTLLTLDPQRTHEAECSYLCHHILQAQDLVVLDGYDFNTDYQEEIHDKGCLIACIDDIHSYPFLADAVINHAGGMREDQYRHAFFTQLYLGPAYALLRRVFYESARKPRTGESRCVFICFGGADPNNDTLHVLKHCTERRPDLEYAVVLGPAYRHREVLEAFIRTSPARIGILENLPADEMADVMLGSCCGITAASTVSYEYLHAGRQLYVKQIAGNQEDLYRFLTGEGLALPWEHFGGEPAEWNAERQQAVFDGKAGERLVRIFERLAREQEVHLREADSEDVDKVYFWANDPENRAQSFSSAAIPYETHQAWFENKLKNPACFYYILENGNQPIGQIRFDTEWDQAVISYALDPAWRGKGYGTILLKKGLRQLQRDWKHHFLATGAVKSSNPASMRSFDHLHFQRRPHPELADAWEYRLKIH